MQQPTFVRNKFAGNLCMWLIVITCFYYPLAASIITYLGLPSTLTNTVIRAMCSSMALILIVKWLIIKNKTRSFAAPVWSLILFWIFYSARILFDLNRGIRFGDYPNSYIYGFTFGNILLPVFAIVFWAKHIDIKKMPTILLFFFLIINVSMTSIITQQAEGFNATLFLTRNEVISESNQGGTTLNPITIAYYGELLLLVALYHLVFKTGKFTIISLLGIALGTSCLFLGASRGPFLSSALCLIFILMYTYQISKERTVLTLKIATLFTFLFVIWSQTIGKSFSLDDFYIFSRLTETVETTQSGGEEYRNLGFASAWQDFLDSPIIGKQFVGTFDNFYPHNIVLELFMATGVIGALIFIGFFYKITINLFHIFTRKDYNNFFILMIYMPIFMSNLTSGCLFMGIEFWLFSSLILMLKFNNKSIVGFISSKYLSKTNV
jgi:hypothetical protein